MLEHKCWKFTHEKSNSRRYSLCAASKLNRSKLNYRVSIKYDSAPNLTS